MNPTASLASLHWLRPQWLWLLCALPLLLAWWHATRRRHGAWRDLVDPHLLPHLLDVAPGVRGQGRLWLGVLGAALAICALAGPSWRRVQEPLWQSRAPLVIALDLSSATLANDLPSSRLLQARAKIAQLLHARSAGQVGLVAFADDAYTVAPLTDDANNVALFLDALSPDVMPVDGSHADRAVALSAKLLHQAGFDSGDILLITDHADASADAAAKVAHASGYRVSALGLGTAAGAAYRDADGHIRQARLDAASLRDLASAGAGAYAALTAGADDLAVLGVLDPIQADARSAHRGMTSAWQDQGYWLLPPLLLLGVFAFRRGGALAGVLLCMLLPLQPARAAETGWWQRPDQQAHARFVHGADAYRQGDFAAASRQWQALPGADAAYDRGNALARQGQYDAAIAAFDQALRLRPRMADAIANRDQVLRAKRRQQQQAQSNPKQPGQGKPGQQGQPSQSHPQPGQQGKNTAPDAKNARPPGSPPHDASPPAQAAQPSAPKPDASPDKPADAKAQRQADAAQRARMQQALHKARDPANGNMRAQPVARAETPAQRERRIANDAWLRRVPDDPGGLLRAKFQLEYERRQQGGP